jgi:hypothetical protein
VSCASTNGLAIVGTCRHGRHGGIHAQARSVPDQLGRGCATMVELSGAVRSAAHHQLPEKQNGRLKASVHGK